MAAWGVVCMAGTAKRVLRHHPLGYGAAADKVLLEDFIKSLAGYLPIPDTLGIDHHPGTPGTNPEAPSLGAHRGHICIAQAVFYVFPQRLALVFRAAAVGPDTDKDVLLGSSDTGFCQTFLNGMFHGNSKA